MNKTLSKFSVRVAFIILAAYAFSVFRAPIVKAEPFDQTLTLQSPAAQYVEHGYLEYPYIINDFYAGRAYESYWGGKAGAYSNAKALVSTLETAWTHGLNPDHYHLQRIKTLLNVQDLPLGSRAELDVLLTDAYIRYMRDISGRRIDVTGTIFSSKNWRRSAAPKQIIDLLQNGGASMDSILAHYLPSSRTYAQLRDALITAYNAAQYSESGEERRTQKEKVEILIANMERMRWITPNQPRKFVVVNIPSTRLWAIEDGDVVYDLPVIVGRTTRPTNAFTTQITGVRLNPTWTVPKTIKREDIWPKLKADPNYLSTKGMTLVSYKNGGKTINPSSVNWSSLSASDLHGYGMIQSAGRHNPLGQARFLMPNGYDIFIHGSNRASDFSRDSALLSSGCVRMKNPEILADFVMKNDAGWRTGHAKEIINSGKSRDIITQYPIPIYLLYYTAWVNPDGTIVYGNDIYNQDKLVINALRKIDGYKL